MQLTLVYENTFYHSQDQFFVEIPPSQIPTRNLKKLVLRMIKFVFHKEKLDPIDTVYEKHILSFSRGAFHFQKIFLIILLFYNRARKRVPAHISKNRSDWISNKNR